MAYVKPGMNVGSRISCIIPFRIPSNSWESGLTWTYYGNHQKTSINIPATPGVTVIRDSTHLTPIFTNMTHIPMAQGADVSWKLLLNVLDLELAKHFSPLPSLLIRAHAGIRGAWINQTLDITYTDVTINSFITPFGSILSHNKINFSGWGLRVGVDNAWHLRYGFKMYVNMGISILDAVFKNVQNQSSGSGQKEVFLTSKFYDTSPVLDLLGGFAWEKNWESSGGISVYLLWEENLWFHQNQLSYFTTQGVPGHTLYFSGNLGFSGPVVGVNLAF